MTRIEVFTTSILSNPKIRQRHEATQRALLTYKNEVTTFDVAYDEEAKTRWKRLNGGNNQLPAIFTDGKAVGSVEQLEEAVEDGQVKQFLRLDQDPSASATGVADEDLADLSIEDADKILQELGLSQDAPAPAALDSAGPEPEPEPEAPSTGPAASEQEPLSSASTDSAANKAAEPEPTPATSEPPEKE